ncbi:glycosyltransferase [Photobacterium sp. S4TG1]|uniref:glycosyltransferase n=1 Tax=Photobacterium sp. S4TG1 TaxID=3114587 RepID=UPI002E1845EE|nr:glycosyltransferase [Photobacterium sp. S4TG1]
MSIKEIIKKKYKELPYNYRVKCSKIIWYTKRTDALIYKIKSELFNRFEKNKVSNNISSNIVDNIISHKKEVNNSIYDYWDIQGDLFLINTVFKNTSKDSYFVFPVIDWHFRVQRPQHIARELGLLGHKVVYLTTTFNLSTKPGFKIIESPSENILICQLNFNKKHINIYHDKLDNDDVVFLLKSVNSIRSTFNMGYTNSLVDLPFWSNISIKLTANNVIYDCMDHHAGFENNTLDMLNEEEDLLLQSDLVITTAERLSNIISEKRDNIIIRNAAEVDFFSKKDPRVLYEKKRKTIGYYGAIAEWFDIELLRICAKQTPEYDYLIIGNVTTDLKGVDKLDNVNFIGEVPYSELPAYLNSFDVCLIPFKLIELTLCTNPVKVYEYLAAGKPVVSTAMPEVLLMAEHLHIGNSREDFVNKIHSALDEVGNKELSDKRRGWALTQDWSSRAESIVENVKLLNNEKSHIKKVSLVVLTYNNLELTKDCLNGIDKNTYYPNYEVIIVDNMSTDGTRDFLNKKYSNKDKYKVILNDDNLGFSAGNNIGLAAADGDILIVINNDTYPAPYWLSGIVEAFNSNNNLGLCCPITNNIGNEAKLNIEYDSFNNMNIFASNLCANNIGNLYSVNNIAFFCAAFTRDVYKTVGPMCEEYGLGFFEDDDYCARVRELGFDISIVDYSFVHHHLSASFNKLKDNKKELLMLENKAIFESKWGSWVPHKYRPGVH